MRGLRAWATRHSSTACSAAVMGVIALVGAIYFFAARPDRKIATHRHEGSAPREAPPVTAA
jgi:hypothetical protein